MNIRLALLLTLVFSVASIVPGYAAGDRYALVIGNAKYPDAEAPLREPINDARDVAEELKRDGFSVEIGENLTGEAMRRAFDRFYGKVKPGSVALIFFSGLWRAVEPPELHDPGRCPDLDRGRRPPRRI